jgi:ABC-type Fe3+ transport system substrate-binding protein
MTRPTACFSVRRALSLGALCFSLALGSGAASAQAMLTYKGADRTQKLIDGAKKEGALVFYSAMIENQALKPIVTAFQQKYPFIHTTYWRADTEGIVAKLSAEVRSRNVVADVVEGTDVGELGSSAHLLAPYYTPLIAQYPAEERDPNSLWTPTRISYFSIAYNTKLVPPNDVPKTFQDLLNPKWKGKMVWRIGTSSGAPLFITNLRLAWGEAKAMDYFRKLAGQKIVNFGSGSARTLVDRTLAGEYAIALNIFAHHPLISKQAGAPVDSRLMDPVAATTATMGVVVGAHHPNAALLLVDFILSPEGQKIMAGAQYFPARPDVPPLAQIAPVVPKNAGAKENFISPATLLKYTPSSQKIVQDLFR